MVDHSLHAVKGAALSGQVPDRLCPFLVLNKPLPDHLEHPALGQELTPLPALMLLHAPLHLLHLLRSLPLLDHVQHRTVPAPVAPALRAEEPHLIRLPLGPPAPPAGGQGGPPGNHSNLSPAVLLVCSATNCFTPTSASSWNMPGRWCMYSMATLALSSTVPSLHMNLYPLVAPRRPSFTLNSQLSGRRLLRPQPSCTMVSLRLSMSACE